MAKFNVRAYTVKAPIDMTKIDDSAVFQPCAAGNEMSTGLIAAGPAQDSLVWHMKDRYFLEYAVETRRVPKKWLEAEVRRRVLPSHTLEEKVSISDMVKAELWQKIIPTKKYGWVCYLPEAALLLICGSVRHTEYVTSVLRQAIGSLNISNAFDASAFELAVKGFINGELEYEDLRLGSSVSLFQGKTVVSFKNFHDLQENGHVADHMRLCSGVASAGFVHDGVVDDVDDVTATPFAELAITEVKDKEADENGTMIIRADRAKMFVDIIRDAIKGYVKDTGAKV